MARGQLLYQIYSPELVAAQKDFLASLNIGNKNRINATEQRLRSLGMQRNGNCVSQREAGAPRENTGLRRR